MSPRRDQEHAGGSEAPPPNAETGMTTSRADSALHRIPLRARDGSVRAWALVDAEDFERVGTYRWHLTNGYVATTTRRGGRKYELLLHRLVMDAPPEMEVDHIYGDRLDNRRSRLRLVTPDQNKQNLRAHRDNASGKRGVSWAPHVQLWRGRVHHAGQTYCCGYHQTAEEASAAVSMKRAEVMTHSEELRHEP